MLLSKASRAAGVSPANISQTSEAFWETWIISAVAAVQHGDASQPKECPAASNASRMTSSRPERTGSYSRKDAASLDMYANSNLSSLATEIQCLTCTARKGPKPRHDQGSDFCGNLLGQA